MQGSLALTDDGEKHAAADPPQVARGSALLRSIARFAWLLRRSAEAAVEHDALTVAQATAYSAMVALFPALIVAAAVIGLAPSMFGLRLQLAIFFARVLPSNVLPVLGVYFSATRSTPQTAGALASAAIVSISGASSVMATLMEGFRRAQELPLTQRGFWSRRARALALVPVSLLPMALASALVVFGHVMTHWLVGEVTPALRAPVYVVAFLLRWSIALAGSVGIIAVIYHLGTELGTGLGTQMRQQLEPLLREPWMALRKDWSWRASLPGATVATVLWFVSTLLFGYYVTRFANYSRVYGSLGAAIALLFWLYIIALSVLMGAEFNAQRAVQGPGRRDPRITELLWKIPGLRPRRAGRISH